MRLSSDKPQHPTNPASSLHEGDNFSGCLAPPGGNITVSVLEWPGAGKIQCSSAEHVRKALSTCGESGKQQSRLCSSQCQQLFAQDVAERRWILKILLRYVAGLSMAMKGRESNQISYEG